MNLLELVYASTAGTQDPEIDSWVYVFVQATFALVEQIYRIVKAYSKGQ